MNVSQDVIFLRFLQLIPLILDVEIAYLRRKHSGDWLIGWQMSSEIIAMPGAVISNWTFPKVIIRIARVASTPGNISS
ncbi:hypothetical protein [Spirosoma foliorum]|uniref:Uncharacterized protein n=1 Tax=Spirosoma foliorum TaxID=2710596 RepID=A0A7G5H5E6_9BACT|nr:hypothetical protein [Spirosoma foliorum]QMW06338.1 hypothetical protein H3H32_16340 [Spirosoma foliorum]